MSIVALPQHVTAQINSSSSFTCLNDVVLALFKNSLDASCTKIEITVDYSRGLCVVEDNGVGILPSEFRESGGLGKPYHTSKQYETEVVHGRRGNSLASISAIAFLTITSHHFLYQSHNTLCINNSAVLFRQLPALPQHHLLYDHGTRVTIHNLFGNIPVRIKQRVINSRKQGGNGKEWNDLLIGLIRLLFPWTRAQVSVTMRDKITNNKIYLQAPSHKSVKESPIKKFCSILRQASIITAEDTRSWIPVQAPTEGLRIIGAVSLQPYVSKRCQFLSFGIKPIFPEESSLYEDINKLFSNSSFGNIEVASKIEGQEIKHCKDDKRCKRTDYTSKELKCVKGIEKWPKFYLNILPEVTVEKSLSDYADCNFWTKLESYSMKVRELLQELIWKFLSDNSFLPRPICQKRFKKDGLISIPAVESLPQSMIMNSTQNHPLSSTSSLAQRKKIIHNEFGMDIKLPSFRQNVLSLELSNDITSKIKRGKLTRASSISMLNNESKLDDQEFTERSFSLPLKVTNVLEPRVCERQIFKVSEKKIFSMSAKPLTCELIKDSEVPEKCSCNFLSKNDSDFTPSFQPSEIHRPIAPKDTISSRSNSMTHNQHNFGQRIDFLVAPQTFQLESSTKRFFRQKICTKMTPNDPNSWMSQCLRSWNNPVYVPAEKPIPQLSIESQHLKQRFSAGQFQNYIQADANHRPDMKGARLNNRISKRALKDAKFISQVDNKFIFVKVFTTDCKELAQRSEDLLVMIDQHAADERIRIESLLEELCTPAMITEVDSPYRVKSYILMRPLIISLPPNEIELLFTYRNYFLSWGFSYKLPAHGSVSNQTNNNQTLIVLSLPPVIAERCQQQPHLLSSLLRKEICKLQDSNDNLQVLSTFSSSTSWLDRIHTCPVGVLDLLNTRACRSAIMFNDELSEEQCRILVKRLAECSFPFMCAHGRPSMVPLAKLSTLGFNQDSSQIWNSKGFLPTLSLGAQFKKWKRQRYCGS